MVYSYTDPREQLPFYIGKGRPDRPYNHLLDCQRLRGRTHFYCRLNKMLAEGFSPHILILASDLPEQAAFDLEIALIKQYGRLDQDTGCLTNHTDGGEGVSGGHWASLPRTVEQCLAHKPHSQETKSRLRAAAANRRHPIESYDLTTNITIKQYTALQDVEKDGFSRSGVSHCLQGKTRSSGYRGWRDISQEEKINEPDTTS